MRNKPKSKPKQKPDIPKGFARMTEQRGMAVVPLENGAYQIQNTLDLDEPFFTLEIHTLECHELSPEDVYTLFTSALAQYEEKQIQEQNP